jgi:hypothetical protein
LGLDLRAEGANNNGYENLPLFGLAIVRVDVEVEINETDSFGMISTIE